MLFVQAQLEHMKEVITEVGDSSVLGSIFKNLGIGSAQKKPTTVPKNPADVCYVMNEYYKKYRTENSSCKRSLKIPTIQATVFPMLCVLFAV